MKFIQEGFLEEIKKANSEWETINKQVNLGRGWGEVWDGNAGSLYC